MNTPKEIQLDIDPPHEKINAERLLSTVSKDLTGEVREKIEYDPATKRFIYSQSADDLPGAGRVAVVAEGTLTASERGALFRGTIKDGVQRKITALWLWVGLLLLAVPIVIYWDGGVEGLVWFFGLLAAVYIVIAVRLALGLSPIAITRRGQLLTPKLPRVSKDEYDNAKLVGLERAMTSYLRDLQEASFKQ